MTPPTFSTEVNVEYFGELLDEDERHLDADDDHLEICRSHHGSYVTANEAKYYRVTNVQSRG